MQIAEHHRPDHWSAGLLPEPAYEPACAWPEKCLVQWGGHGVVLSTKGNYQTAFFEAFPGDNAGGFIRGEGTSIAEAEAQAFAKYTREIRCQHRWGRKGYLNGGAFCYGCGAFKTVFHPVHILGDWRKPISRMEDDCLGWPPLDEAGVRMRHKIRMRKNLFGVEQPR